MSLGISCVGSRVPCSPSELYGRAGANGTRTAKPGEAEPEATGAVEAGQTGASGDRSRAAGNGVPVPGTTDLSTVFQSLSTSTLSSILQLVSGAEDDGASAAQAGRFHDLDSDGNGTVSRTEFVAGRPDNVSEDDAGSLYDRITGEKADGLTAAPPAGGRERIDGPQGDRPPPPPPPDDEAASVEDAPTDEEAGTVSRRSTLPEDLKPFDSNDDGTISGDEFAARRPDDIRQAPAAAPRDDVTGDEADGQTADRLARRPDRAEAPRGHRGPPDDAAANVGDPAADETASAESAEKVDRVLVDQLLATLKSVREGYAQYSGQAFGISAKQFDTAT